MFSAYIEEQLGRCDRALRDLLRYRDVGVPMTPIERLSDDELADYGLTREQVGRRDEILVEASRAWVGPHVPEIHQLAARIRAAELYDTPRKLDALFNFAQTCWHLRDWIHHDPTQTLTRKGAIEQFVRRCDDLKIAADLCNGTKHLKLETPRTSEPPRYVGGSAGSNAAGMMVTDKLLISESRIDAFAWAERCMAHWREFLETNAPKIPAVGVGPIPPPSVWPKELGGPG